MDAARNSLASNPCSKSRRNRSHWSSARDAVAPRRRTTATTILYSFFAPVAPRLEGMPATVQESLVAWLNSFALPTQLSSLSDVYDCAVLSAVVAQVDPKIFDVSVRRGRVVTPWRRVAVFDVFMYLLWQGLKTGFWNHCELVTYDA